MRADLLRGGAAGDAGHGHQSVSLGDHRDAAFYHEPFSGERARKRYSLSAFFPGAAGKQSLVSVQHVSIPFLAIGAVSFTRRLFREREPARKTRDLALWGFFVTGVWVGIITYQVNVNRINIIFYPMIMLCGYGLWWTAKRLRSRAKLFVPAAACVYGLCAVWFLFTYFTDFREESRIYYNEDFLEAARDADRMEEYDTLYVTGNMGWQFNREMAEILTQYSCEIDALYYQEKSDVTGGRRLLPYSERYHFLNMRTMDGQEPVLDDKTLFLVHQEDLQYLKFTYRILERKGDFVILTPAAG